MKQQLNKSIVLNTLLFLIITTSASCFLSNSRREDQLIGIQNYKRDPDDGLTIPQIIESRGFEYDSIILQTKDGYLLNHHRIINPVIGIKYKRPVVMFHGLLASASEYILNPGGHINETLPPGVIGNNLAFELAKRGYDVWLCNNRGNEYGTGHAWLKTSSKQFWNFSKDEFIKFDLPDTLEYIQKATNSTKLAYVGHSQGTHIMFGLLATQKKYNDIIEPFIALAPVGTVKHITALLRFLANQKYLYRLSREFKRFLKPEWVETHVANICRGHRSKFCANLVFLFNGGIDSGQLNNTRIPVYLSNLGYGTSTKNIVSWGQNVLAGRFNYYDYGYATNKQLYGTFQPPEYKLHLITNKHIALLSSVADNLGDPKDVDILRSKLKVKPVMDYVVPLADFSHLDFAIGKDVGYYVYRKVFELLKNYQNVMLDG